MELEWQEERLDYLYKKAEKQAVTVELLKQRIIEQKKHERDHLQVIGELGELTSDQKKAIKRNPIRGDDMDSWRRRIEKIRTTYDRNVRIEVTFSPNEKKYHARIFKGRHLSETVTLPAWNKIGIKRLIDRAQEIKVPWKQIEYGQPWIADIKLNPYYIEKNWVPQNVIPFTQRLTK
ncbi:MAG TPA: hypothetical protein VIG33_07630 [Pseudobdellovibrionaceae bacterium]|jgi:hypothetical protein